jgi:xanthine dehydrogenase YagR molybdenum-binding subunit
MEPNACVAVPRGEYLELYVSTQIVDAARSSVANTLKIDPHKIKVVSAYVGGGFGSKLSVHSETILAAIAARRLNRPIKVALTRRQIFHDVGVRPSSVQRIRLGADRDGKLVAIGHDATMHTNPEEEFVETSALGTRSFYAAPNRLTRHRLVPLDMLRGEDVRAPGEASGLLTLESAMDELAYALNMDPIELRIRNEPTLDPERNVPYSERHVIEMPSRRSAAIQMGTAPATAGSGARRQMACRLRRRGGDSCPPAIAIECARAAGPGRQLHGVVRYDRHWDRHLHNSRPNSG